MNSGHLVINSKLLESLNTYINEDEISDSIVKLSTEVEKIELVSGKSARTSGIRQEIANLEDQLTYSRNQASLRTQQYRNSNL